ncbi:hypothetical protein IHQ71_11640 [Rhizobium sp. TH2]|uniref:hypothetical protein n=1 Tax=Rhizobium sp. TH2 TaxID=2775403 RepID=UPI0021581281|nr:hypothetical protein [Rhizobium sp. TH2]UVC11164.1 hypothetical protein IHQ71_11640 [Rhizobium sp. TH2]
MSVSGVYQPSEFEVVHDVFKRIARETWFDRTIARQRDFAAFCLRAYQSGVTDPDRLFEECERVARARYAWPT